MKETHKTNLFSLQDVMKGALRLFTLIALLLHHVYVWSYLAKIPQMKLEEETKKKLLIFNYGPRFLTNWNFFHQTAYLLVALICHIGPKETFHKLRRYNWFHFWSVVFPWTIFIPCIFWMIFNYDRELIFPKVIDVVIPSWVNHAIHTNIVAVIVLEVLLVDERPPRWRPAFRLLTVYSLIYVSVLLLTYFQSSFWLYKFLGVLTWPQKIASFLAIYAFCTTVMWIGMSFQSQKYQNSIASVGAKKVS